MTITFPELYYGKTRTVKLTYTVKGGRPRSESATRTMRAYASFCAIANGVDRGTVTVRIPKGFRVSTSGAKLRAKVVGKERVFTSGSDQGPGAWSACFTGANDAGYRTQQLAGPDGGTIQLRSWPEDPAWAKSVGRRRLGEPAAARAAHRHAAWRRRAASGSRRRPTGAEYAGSYDAGHEHGHRGRGLRPAGGRASTSSPTSGSTAAAFKETWLSEGFAEWAGRAVSGEEACGRPDVAAGTVRLADWRYLSRRRPAPRTRDAVDRSTRRRATWSRRSPPRPARTG